MYIARDRCRIERKRLADPPGFTMAAGAHRPSSWTYKARIEETRSRLKFPPNEVFPVLWPTGCRSHPPRARTGNAATRSRADSCQSRSDSPPGCPPRRLFSFSSRLRAPAARTTATLVVHTTGVYSPKLRRSWQG